MVGSLKPLKSQEIKGSILFHCVPFDLYTINTGLRASLFLFPSSKVTQKAVGSLMIKGSLQDDMPGPLCLSALLAGVPDSSWGRGGSFPLSGADAEPLGRGRRCSFINPLFFLGLKWSF